MARITNRITTAVCEWWCTAMHISKQNLDKAERRATSAPKVLTRVNMNFAGKR